MTIKLQEQEIKYLKVLLETRIENIEEITNSSKLILGEPPELGVLKKLYEKICKNN